jgi:hypothetical protein
MENVWWDMHRKICRSLCRVVVRRVMLNKNHPAAFNIHACAEKMNMLNGIITCISQIFMSGQLQNTCHLTSYHYSTLCTAWECFLKASFILSSLGPECILSYWNEVMWRVFVVPQTCKSHSKSDVLNVLVTLILRKCLFYKWKLLDLRWTPNRDSCKEISKKLEIMRLYSQYIYSLLLYIYN